MATPSTIARLISAVRRGRAASDLSATLVIGRAPRWSRGSRPRSARRGRARSAPSARNRTRSAWAAARGSCVTIRIVWPSESTVSRSRPRISEPERESRLPVGSSANRIVGLETRARATATRCCWPPDSSDGLWSRRSVSPTRSSSASRVAPSTLRPAIFDGSRMFSSAESVGSRLKAWKMKPTLSRRSFVRSLSDIWVISRPPITTLPSVGRSRPASMCISVDLPEPEGPMTAVYWPAGTCRETPRRASTALSPSP